MVVMLLMVPINILTGNKMKKYQKAQMLYKDQRVKLMDEVLNGMKVLKLYAWEPSFSEKLLATREQEVSALKKVRVMVKVEAFKSIESVKHRSIEAVKMVEVFKAGLCVEALTIIRALKSQEWKH